MAEKILSTGAGSQGGTLNNPTTTGSTGVTLVPTYGTPTTVGSGPATGGTSSSTTQAPASLATLLTNAQADVTQAQNAYTTIQNEISVLQVLAPLAQSLVQQATSGNPPGTQAQLTAAQTVAIQMQAILTDINNNNTKASNASANAYQQTMTAFGEGDALPFAQNSNYAAISAASAQATSTAALAKTAANGTVAFALLAQGILAITKPGPQVLSSSVSGTTIPTVTPISFNPKATLTGTFPGNVLGLKIDESDTQSLLSFLSSNDGGSVASVLIGGLSSAAISVVTGLLGAGVSIPSLVGALVKMMAQLEVQLFAAVIGAADNKHLGVTFNFGLTVLGLALGAGDAIQDPLLTAEALFATAEPNLISEQSHPGGSGSWQNGFWIMGNTQ